jgi:hypothetical protein
VSTDSCSRASIPASLFKGANRALAPQLLEIVEGLEEWWPMTLRQVFYQAVAALAIRNTHAQYRRVMGIFKRLRESDVLPYHAMEDRSRRTTDKRGLSGLAEFVHENLETALNPRYYHRCYLQGQKRYVEVSLEKDALAPLVEDACWPLCTRVNMTRGHLSVTMVEQIAGRMNTAMQRGQECVLLHFGDLDPTGVQIPLSVQAALERVHGLRVSLVVGGLTPEQCVAYALPQSLDAEKATDPNIKRWRQRYPGQAPTELDALHPRDLMQLVERQLLALYDDSMIEEQRAKERADELVLKRMRASMLAHLRSAFPHLMREVDQ